MHVWSDSDKQYLRSAYHENESLFILLSFHFSIKMLVFSLSCFVCMHSVFSYVSFRISHRKMKANQQQLSIVAFFFVANEFCLRAQISIKTMVFLSRKTSNYKSQRPKIGFKLPMGIWQLYEQTNKQKNHFNRISIRFHLFPTFTLLVNVFVFISRSIMLIWFVWLELGSFH